MNNINKEKFYRIANKLKRIPFESLKVDDIFLYAGNIYGNVPMEVQRVNHEKFDIEFGLEILDDSYYILEFIKKDDDLVQETITGCFFKVNKNDEEFDYHNPTEILGSVPERFLHLSKYGIVDPKSFYSQMIYLLYGEEKESALKEGFANLKSRAREAYINRASSIYRKIYTSEAERKFYEKESLTLSFYSDKPEIGEYFGYAGDIYSLVPMENEITSEKWFRKCRFESQQPLLFKKVSEDEAIEVTSGIKFRISDCLSEYISSDKDFIDTLLGIEPISYIETTNNFKKIYAKSIKDFEEFSKLLHQKEKEVKEKYDEAIRKYESSQYISLEEAYDIARVDNAIFDLEKQSSATEPRIHKLIKEISTVTSDFD